MIVIIPRTNPMLAILDPKTLPIAKFENPSSVAFKLTINSGADVAKETIVIPIIIFGTENCREISTEDLVSRSPPCESKIIPNKIPKKSKIKYLRAMEDSNPHLKSRNLLFYSVELIARDNAKICI